MSEASPLGAILTAAVPVLPEDEAARLLARHWGLTGRLGRLTSERDLNWKLESEEGDFVVKLANPAEPAEVTDFQTRALLHLEPHGLPVPRPRCTLAGDLTVALPEGRLRVLSYLDGRMMHAVAPSAALRRAVGRMGARLARGLAGFAHPAADHDLPWDVRHAGRLAPLLPDLPPDLRPLARAALDRFATEVAPDLSQVPWQVVHNDLNPHNVLVSPDGQEVAGILDFGDMVRTARVCDLGVAASYQVIPEAPLESLTQFAAAWHAEAPLTPAEVRLILPLTEARWLTTLAITAHRAARQPENAAYILRNAPQARAGLLAFAALDRPRATAALLDALRPDP